MLKAVNIKKSYAQKENVLDVLRGIDITFGEGEIVSIVGPSGAGKSTLLHILGGLDKPSDGVVYLETEDLYKLNDIKRARARNTKIGFVFQFYHLLPEFTAVENVILPLLVKKDRAKSKSSEKKGIELLDKVGLRQRSGHKPNQLSGGEQQRVAIARALINDPKIIFCDEPTGNLDSKSGMEIIDLLLDLNKKNGQTIIIVTHDQDIAKRCHKTIYMRDGKLFNK